jgi:hypothetical protein
MDWGEPHSHENFGKLYFRKNKFNLNKEVFKLNQTSEIRA